MKLEEKEHYIEIDIIKDGNKIGRCEIITETGILNGFEIYAPYQNKGYGQEALKLLIDKYNIRELWVKYDNEIARHIYEKCGFEYNETPLYAAMKRN